MQFPLGSSKLARPLCVRTGEGEIGFSRLATEIDRRLRHSAVGRAQPWVKQRSPALHRLLLGVRDAILPFRSRFGLSRYQHRTVERFPRFDPDLEGPVLEIGSDSAHAVLSELAARGAGRVLGVNPAASVTPVPGDHAGPRSGRPAGALLLRADARRLPLASASISAAFSVATLELILDLDRALLEIHRVLKPRGLFYADFGPIWSSSVGHHVYAVVDGVEARHFKPGRNPVPHFGHLPLDREELRARVLDVPWVFPRLADAIVRRVFEDAGINRLFYEDYVALFSASPFEIVHLEPVCERVPVATRERLERRFPGRRDFDAHGRGRAA